MRLSVRWAIPIVLLLILLQLALELSWNPSYSLRWAVGSPKRPQPGLRLDEDLERLSILPGCPVQPLNGGLGHYFTGLPVERLPSRRPRQLRAGRTEWEALFGEPPRAVVETIVGPAAPAFSAGGASSGNNTTAKMCTLESTLRDQLNVCHDSKCQLPEPPPQWQLFDPPTLSARCQQRKFSWLEKGRELHMCCPSQLAPQVALPNSDTPVSWGSPPGWPPYLYEQRAWPVISWMPYEGPFDARALAATVPRLTYALNYVLARCGGQYNIHFFAPAIPEARARAQRVLASAAALGSRWRPLPGLSAERIADLPPLARPLNVVVLLVDSVSRLAFSHYAPRTVAWLLAQANGAEEARRLEVVNFARLLSVGPNSPPNQVPLYSGRLCNNAGRHIGNRLTARCEAGEGWLWAQAKAAGYVSLMVHEECRTFVGALRGFTNPANNSADAHPAMASCHGPRHVAYSMGERGMPSCIQQELQMTHAMRVADDFLAEHGGDVPVFASITLSSFHTNYWPAIAQLDAVLPEYLQRMTADGNTAVVLMSDHGNNHAPLASTTVGLLEHALPFATMLLPRGAVAPSQLAMLRRNSLRMTAPFDMHLTLKQLLLQGSGRALVKDAAQRPWKQARAYNLMHEEVPRDRSCRTLHPNPALCPCGVTQLEELPDGPQVRQLLLWAVDNINGRFAGLRNSSCMPLQLRALQVARYSHDPLGQLPSVVHLYYTTQPDVQRGQHAAQPDAQLPLPEQQFYTVFKGPRPAPAGQLDKQLYHRQSTKQMSVWGHMRSCADDRVHAQFCVCRLD